MNVFSKCVFVLCLVIGSTACKTGRSQPAQWVSATVEAPNEAVLWDLALLAMAQSDYPIGAGVDPAKRVALTGWRFSLAPFKGQGYRQRARLKLTPKEDGRYEIALHVEKETNEDVVRPMELEYAKWEEAPDDLEAAQILLARIEARLGGAIDVGERRRRALDGGR